jgi:NAD(P)-dependent dehydrogenase (short-subunit alcohol dehydrogenase family)
LTNLGANSGIGFETAKAFVSASPSYHVLLACRSIEKAEQAIADIKSTDHKGTLSALHLDVTDETIINAAVETVSSTFGRLDIQINNAGVHSKAPGLPAQMRDVLETNTTGPAAMTEAFKHLMKKSTNPRLIFVSSSVGSITLRGDPTNKSYNGSAIAYRVSKAALNMLTACYAKELNEEFGCKVWAVDPGLVITNLTGNPEMLRARGAGDPAVSAKTILDVCEGKRDGDIGKLLYKDGVLPW